MLTAHTNERWRILMGDNDGYEVPYLPHNATPLRDLRFLLWFSQPQSDEMASFQSWQQRARKKGQHAGQKLI